MVVEFVNMATRITVSPVALLTSSLDSAQPFRLNMLLGNWEQQEGSPVRLPCELGWCWSPPLLPSVPAAVLAGLMPADAGVSR